MRTDMRGNWTAKVKTTTETGRVCPSDLAYTNWLDVLHSGDRTSIERNLDGVNISWLFLTTTSVRAIDM